MKSSTTESIAQKRAALAAQMKALAEQDAALVNAGKEELRAKFNALVTEYGYADEQEMLADLGIVTPAGKKAPKSPKGKKDEGKMNKGPISEADKATMRRLKAEGKTVEDIAKEVKRKVEAVAKVLAEPAKT